MTAPLTLEEIAALLEMEAHLPKMVWRGCGDHPEHNSNSSCWGLYEPGAVGERLRLMHVGERLCAARNALPALLSMARELVELSTPRHESEWHEETGPVLWWKLPVNEPPYCGTPLDDDWPVYHTWWTPLPTCPAMPLGWDPKAKDSK